jgi:hypothetical protein
VGCARFRGTPDIRTYEFEYGSQINTKERKSTVTANVDTKMRESMKTIRTIVIDGGPRYDDSHAKKGHVLKRVTSLGSVHWEHSLAWDSLSRRGP